MIVGARILERMELVGISQAELARRVGMKQPSIFNLIHKGKKGSTKLHLIARELGTTPAYLTGETDDPESTAAEPSLLSSEQRELLDRFAELQPVDRRALLQITRSLATAASLNPTLHSRSAAFRGFESE